MESMNYNPCHADCIIDHDMVAYERTVALKFKNLNLCMFDEMSAEEDCISSAEGVVQTSPLVTCQLQIKFLKKSYSNEKYAKFCVLVKCLEPVRMQCRFGVVEKDEKTSKHLQSSPFFTIPQGNQEPFLAIECVQLCNFRWKIFVDKYCSADNTITFLLQFRVLSMQMNINALKGRLAGDKLQAQEDDAEILVINKIESMVLHEEDNTSSATESLLSVNMNQQTESKTVSTDEESYVVASEEY